jgi:hypothetical protein
MKKAKAKTHDKNSGDDMLKKTDPNGAGHIS